MDNALIGQRIRQLRLDRQLRQGDVAKKLGISPAYLNLIEKGKRTVQFPLLWKVLQLFDQDLETFMRTVGESRPDDALGAGARAQRGDGSARIIQGDGGAPVLRLPALSAFPEEGRASGYSHRGRRSAGLEGLRSAPRTREA